MRSFIQQTIFLFILLNLSLLCVAEENCSYQAVNLSEDQFQKFISRKQQPDYHPIFQTIVSLEGFCYIPSSSAEFALDQSWGVWLIFDTQDGISFNKYDHIWLVPMTDEEKAFYPSKEAGFKGDIVIDFPFTHWIISEGSLLAFPAINTPTELHIKCSGLDD